MLVIAEDPFAAWNLPSRPSLCRVWGMAMFKSSSFIEWFAEFLDHAGHNPEGAQVRPDTNLSLVGGRGQLTPGSSRGRPSSWYSRRHCQTSRRCSPSADSQPHRCAHHGRRHGGRSGRWPSIRRAWLDPLTRPRRRSHPGYDSFPSLHSVAWIQEQGRPNRLQARPSGVETVDSTLPAGGSWV